MFLVSQVFGFALAAATSPAPSTLTVEPCKFGEVAAFAAAKCEVELSNIGDRPIRVSDLSSSKEGVSARGNAVVVPAHAKAYMDTTIDVGNSVGAVSYVFRAKSDEPGHDQKAVVVSGFVMTSLDQRRPEIDLGVVDATLATQAPKGISLSSHEVPKFRITRILETPEWLSASITPDGAGVSVHARADASLGLHDGYVKVALNTPRQSQAWILVKADVHGDVVPSANPLDMGLMRMGNNNEFMIRLNSRSGKDFEIGKLELETIKGQLKEVPCEPVAKACRMIRLRISDDQPSGTLKGKLMVDLPALHQRLPVSLWGWLVPKDLKIGTIGPKGEQSGTEHDAASGPMSPAAGTPSNLEDAIKGVVKEEQAKDQPPPPGSGPLLKWAISNGNEVHGFQIFRASNEAGPFLILNPTPIPAVKTATSYAYQWRDNSAEAGKTYWYYIGLVNLDGSKTQLSGAQKIVAK